MTNFAQFLVSGVALGVVYAILALGLTVVFNATDTINVAHGPFVVLGAAFVTSYVAIGVPLLLASALAVVTVGIVAAVEAVVIIVPMLRKNASPLGLLMITFGFSITATELIGRLWGKADIAFGTFVTNKPILVRGVAIQRQTIVIVIVGAVVLTLLGGFFSRARWGRGMLAVSVDRVGASIVGINPELMAVLSFLLSGLLAGLAGVLITPLAGVSYTQGLAFVLAAVTAAVIGGLTSPAGAVVGGLLVGLLTSFSAGYISSSYRDAIVLGALLLVLGVRPSGIVRGLKAVS